MVLGGSGSVTYTVDGGEEETIEVDGTPLAPPYRWVAIGDPGTMSTALAIPGGAVAKVQIDGGTATVSTQDHVEVTATREVADPQYAEPEASGGG